MAADQLPFLEHALWPHSVSWLLYVLSMLSFVMKLAKRIMSGEPPHVLRMRTFVETEAAQRIGYQATWKRLLFRKKPHDTGAGSLCVRLLDEPCDSEPLLPHGVSCHWL